MGRPFAERLKDIEPFRVMEVLDRAKALEAEGRDIVHLEVGEPDFVSARQIIKAGQVSLGVDFGSYLADEYVRLAYTTSMDRLEEAVTRLDRIFG